MNYSKRFVVEPGAPGLTLNAPLFEGIADGKVCVSLGTGTREVPLSSVESARLVFEFGFGGKDNRPHPRAKHGMGNNTSQRKH